VAVSSRPGRPFTAYFAAWRDDGTLAQLHAELRALVRTAAGRKPQPTAAVIDSQSVRAADTVPRASRGWDNAKKVNGRKRHIAVNVMGPVLDVVIHRRLGPGPPGRPAAAVEHPPSLPLRAPGVGLWAMIALMTRRLSQPAK
jgi:hypothetical protein